LQKYFFLEKSASKYVDLLILTNMGAATLISSTSRWQVFDPLLSVERLQATKEE